MNMGLHILKRMQRFQGGTENLEPGPLPPDKKLWGQKELAGLYDPGPGARHDPGDVALTGEAAQDDYNERKSILNDYETMRAASNMNLDELSPDEVDEVLNLHPSDWSDSVREKLGEAFDQPIPQHHQLGASNIMNGPVPPPNPAANPGMRLLMAMQKLRRPQGMRPPVPRPPRRFPPKQQMPPVGVPPQGFAKGSSGIHIKPSHKGLFTAKAKGAGMGVQQYAAKVLAPNSSASAATRKQANFARNARKWNK